MKTMLTAIAEDESFRALTFSVALLILAGSVFYSIHQGWRLLDSFYFSVMTLTTIGYGDFAPSGDLARLFTIAYALSGIGLLVAFVGEIARRSIADRAGHGGGTSDPGSQV
jgi:hypothetical protein